MKAPLKFEDLTIKCVEYQPMHMPGHWVEGSVLHYTFSAQVFPTLNSADLRGSRICRLAIKAKKARKLAFSFVRGLETKPVTAEVDAVINLICKHIDRVVSDHAVDTVIDKITRDCLDMEPLARDPQAKSLIAEADLRKALKAAYEAGREYR